MENLIKYLLWIAFFLMAGYAIYSLFKILGV